MVKAPKGSMGLLALGTDQGTVTVWDLTRGVVATKLGVVSIMTVAMAMIEGSFTYINLSLSLSLCDMHPLLMAGAELEEDYRGGILCGRQDHIHLLH